ncbi:hypothetical protein FGRMN_3983 [Fusarium graminum]|nr:hypothetical protein FGRMN_3983 [Fusarium graminum]
MAEHEEEDVSKSCYSPGSILPLIFEHTSPSGDKQQQILSVEVKRRMEKWTLSCGMVVSGAIPPICQGNTPSELEDEVFLKLYDWRFADQLRRDGRVEPWSSDLDRQFLDGLESGKVQSFRGYLHGGSSQKKLGRPWDQLERDTFLYDEMQGILDNEIATYNRLGKHQGQLIPHFIGKVHIDFPLPSVFNPNPSTTYQVNGILLEYIRGFTLTALADNAPRSVWQDICDQAIKITHILGDHNIINRDVRPDNFMVAPLDKGEYKVYMIDFGQCRLRRDDESDAVWGKLKWQTNEEGCVGYDMQDILREVGFELNYTDSVRYQQWADEDER